MKAPLSLTEFRYNLFAVLKAALAAVHGVGKIEAGLSDFYVTNYRREMGQASLLESNDPTLKRGGFKPAPSPRFPSVTKEVERNYGGMIIALPPSEWTIFSQMSSGKIGIILLQLAEKVNLKKLVSSPRGPKKPKPKRTWDKKLPHVSTARLLAQERLEKLKRKPC